MTKRILFLFIMALGLSSIAQKENIGEDTTVERISEEALAALGKAPKDTAWKIGGHIGLQFNQAAYSNWQAGGINSMAGLATFNLFANYDNGGNWTWVNRANLAYGINYQESVFNKTDDRVMLESRLDRNISKNWSLSGLVNFRTQFADGFAKMGQTEDSVKISTLMAPGYLLAGIGFTYKPHKKFSAYISPVTSKMTWVLDDRLASQGAFGVDTGANFRYEIGGYVNLNYITPVVKNVDLEASLDLFSNYLDGNYKFIDVNGQVLLFMEINKFLSANVSFNVIYDHDILFDTSDRGALRRTQFKEVLGVGFAYRFGYKPAEK
ncbi:MAG: DUF3078 domain-containing protein [Owenweeksia sp.]|nr:DUF3078 domain-containing protein [Owenweeksia sp.]